MFPRNNYSSYQFKYISFNLDIFDNYAWMNHNHFLSINNIFYLQISQFNWPLDAIERQIGRLVNFSWNEKSNRRKFGISRIELGSNWAATKNLTVWAIEFLLLNFILSLFISNRNRLYKIKKVFYTLNNITCPIRIFFLFLI